MQPTRVKVSPNDPCNCGSGKKFKKCCNKPVRVEKRITVRESNSANPLPILMMGLMYSDMINKATGR